VYKDNEWIGTITPSLPIWWYLIGHHMGRYAERKKHEAPAPAQKGSDA